MASRSDSKPGVHVFEQLSEGPPSAGSEGRDRCNSRWRTGTITVPPQPERCLVARTPFGLWICRSAERFWNTPRPSRCARLDEPTTSSSSPGRESRRSLSSGERRYVHGISRRPVIRAGGRVVIDGLAGGTGGRPSRSAARMAAAPKSWCFRGSRRGTYGRRAWVDGKG